MIEARIIDRGRGPEIEGTRITVYVIVDYDEHGCRPDRFLATARERRGAKEREARDVGILADINLKTPVSCPLRRDPSCSHGIL